MKTNIILSIIVLISTAALTSCSTEGGASISGSGMGSASVSGSGSISKSDRR